MADDRKPERHHRRNPMPFDALLRTIIPPDFRGLAAVFAVSIVTDKDTENVEDILLIPFSKPVDDLHWDAHSKLEAVICRAITEAKEKKIL